MVMPKLSLHRLKIEVCRCRKSISVPLIDRVCVACTQLEDEFHFVMICPIDQNLQTRV
jgi:hypothetical protein